MSLELIDETIWVLNEKGESLYLYNRRSGYRIKFKEMPENIKEMVELVYDAGSRD